MSVSNAQTARYGIIGYPLEHSVSPILHNRAFRDYGMNARYEKVPIAPETFEAHIARMKREDWRGFNVTIPFKERILPLLDWVEETAQAIGAVNTVKCEGSRWLGFNTDWLGFLRPVASDLSDFKRCLILGAGGAARAVAFALVKKGAADVLLIANRTKARAEKLARDLRLHGTKTIEATDLETLKNNPAKNFDLIVNTTSLGMNDPGAPLIIDPEPLAHAQTLVYDLIYKPPQTALLLRAKKLGLRTLNGYPMLIYQAEEAFKIWTGKPYLSATVQELLQLGGK